MDYYNYDDDWEHGYGEANCVGDQIMLLESSCSDKRVDSNNNNDTHTTTEYPQQTTAIKHIKAVSGKRDPLKGTECTKVVTTHNKYLALISEDDDGDDSDNDHDHDNNDDNGDGDSWNVVKHRTTKPNKRQRAKKRANTEQQKDDHNHDDDEAIRDAAANNGIPASDWIGIITQSYKCKHNCNGDPSQRKVSFSTQENNDSCNAACTQHDHHNNKASPPMPHATTIIVSTHTHTHTKKPCDFHQYEQNLRKKNWRAFRLSS